MARPSTLNRCGGCARSPGWKLPVKRRKKRWGIGVKQPVIAAYPNHVWAYDFLHDWCPSGRQLKILTVEDEFTRGVLAIEVDYRITARQLCGILQGLMQRRGVPAFVRLGQWPGIRGPVAAADAGGQRGGVQVHRSGQPVAQNGGEERFNGIFRDECAQHGDVPPPGPRASPVPAVSKVLQLRTAAFEPGLSDPRGVRAAAPPNGCRLRCH